MMNNKHKQNYTGYVVPSQSKHTATNTNTAPQIKTSGLSVTLVCNNLKFIPEKQAYEIEINDAFVISTNPQTNSIKICLSTSKMKKINRELADDDIDQLLDEIEDQNDFIHNRDQTLLALQPRNIKKEWGKICQKHPAQFTPTTPSHDTVSRFPSTFDQKVTINMNNIQANKHINNLSEMEPVIFEETCSFYIGQCVNIERIIFVMRYYKLWREYKGIEPIANKKKEINFESMTAFLASLNYNKIDLMNDYLHVKKCHFSNDLIGFFRDKLQQNECDDEEKCVCMQRNSAKREIYSLSKQQRSALYWIDNNAMKEGSLREIREINLQHDLDVIHCSFIHNAMSEGSKYISEISKAANDTEANSYDEKVIYDEFGLYFDYWKENRKDFCQAKYPNLKTELLNNALHKISWNDFNCIYERAKDFLRTEFAKFSMKAKREFDAMKNAVKYGENISIDHVIAIVTYTNYRTLERKLKNGCKRVRNKEKKQDVMQRNMEIANWCRFLKESIYYYGDLLNDTDRLYHGVNKKLMFQRVAKKFNLPMSTTQNVEVANKFGTQNGICLQLGKMFALEENNLFLDVSYFSDYPNENERVIYGGRLGFVDIIYNKLSHADQVISLRLYQKIIDGDWFTRNEKLFTKKYQNEIIKMIHHMMNSKNNNNYKNENADIYIDQLFECIVENVGFGTKTIWINEEECNKLITELNTLLFQSFLPFLRKYYKIRMKYCNLMNMKIKHDALMSSSRQYQLYSSEYRYVPNGGAISAMREEIQLHFRCYRQFDQVKNEDVLMAKFELKSLPKSISSVKMYGGLWFPQIAFDRWDYCTLSHSKMSQGCPLFSLDKIKEIDTLRIEICFQLYRVYDQYGNRLKL